MMQIPRPNQFLAHMRSGRIEHLYSLGNHATHRHVDFVCATGLFDTLWFDLEHFEIPVDQLTVLNMVARAYPVTTLARMRAADYKSVMQVLESGVGGIICAMVDSPEEARQIVRWARFNNPSPGTGETTGQRGWNAGGVDGRYGNLPPADYVAHQNRETAILCQIETEDALHRVDDIVSVKGVDGIFFGPGDYAHRIGRLGQLTHDDVIAAMSRVAAACREHGKFWGTLGIGREMYEKVRALGASFVSPGGDVRVMNLGIRELAKSFSCAASAEANGAKAPARVASGP
jgi:4-hydroxy-2-oxoheptanedioate aldolase